MANSDTYVQVAPDSSGKKVRNIQVTTYVPDATTGIPALATVLMQVTALADDHGNVITEFVNYEFQRQQLELLLQIRDALAELIGHPIEPSGGQIV
jgi:hypothetical protein